MTDASKSYRETRAGDVYPAAARNVREDNNADTRAALYKRSVENPSHFWSDIADQFVWRTKWDRDNAIDANFHKSKGPIKNKWFSGGTTNVSFNCLDRHIAAGRGAQVAYHWEGNEVGEQIDCTYSDLHRQVVDMANVLRLQYGVKKGDVVALYLPVILTGPVAMLAIARLGAICNVIFGGFSSHALASRLIDCGSKVLITADHTMRGDKVIQLKAVADAAVAEAAKNGMDVKMLVYERHERKGVHMEEGRDVWIADAIAKLPAEAGDHVEWVEAEDPLFILYTSGSTGKPKGLVHSSGGYMVYAATTFKHVFDYRPGDVYFCTADIGWITGHTYVVFGPLLTGATSVIYEGLPVHPTPSRWWDIVAKYKVNQFYTAPTAIRSLMKCGTGPVKGADRSSLRVLGSVGEPINRAAWEWYYDVVGDRQCDICDSWWQTETGGIMITPLAGTTPMKPGCASLPFFGVVPAVLDPRNGELKTSQAADGLLCVAAPWPGMARTIFGDHERYEKTYFEFDGYYFSGDGCHRDEDGFVWLTGRVDDVVNVSGHRLGTSEIECAINAHPSVVESAVVGIPHDVKGEALYAYVCFKNGVEITKKLLDEVKMTIRAEIGPIATPDVIHPAIGLPKTRSGKIMRRILRKIAENKIDELGDVSTLAEPAVVPELIELKSKWVTATPAPRL